MVKEARIVYVAGQKVILTETLGDVWLANFQDRMIASALNRGNDNE